jgi:hypothetical protein
MTYDETKYRPGLGRDVPYPKLAHLYELGDDPMDFRLPMCQYGWNRDYGQSYSIWRGHAGDSGICKICIKRANKGLPGVYSKLRK